MRPGAAPRQRRDWIAAHIRGPENPAADQTDPGSMNEFRPMCTIGPSPPDNSVTVTLSGSAISLVRTPSRDQTSSRDVAS